MSKVNLDKTITVMLMQEEEDRRLDQMKMFDRPLPRAAHEQSALNGSRSKPLALPVV